jgi:hypothetical protein
MQETSSAARTWLTKLKVPSGWVVFLGICIATCYYILNPGGKQFIAVPGNELRLEVPLFTRLEIEFTKSVHIDTCILGRPEVYTRVGPASAKTGREMPVEDDSNTLRLQNCFTNQVGPVEQMVQPITIKIASGDRIEIAKASIDDKTIALGKFLTNHLKNRAYLTKCRYLRQTFAHQLSPLNDLISNWILTFMFFGVSWTVVKVVLIELQVYAYNPKMFAHHIRNVSGEESLLSAAARKRALEQCAHIWSRRDTWYKYLQALGPATGFIMTVTSLIYSLSSSKVDIQLLLGGMHIAMVSTFLGLFLRIVALEGERVSVELLAREMAELEVNTPQPGAGAQAA